MSYGRRDDDMAYGDYHEQQDGQEGERGFIGDMGKRLFGGNKQVSIFLIHALHDTAVGCAA